MSGLLAGAALAMLLFLPILVWPGLAFRAGATLELAAKGDSRARAQLLAGLAALGGLMGAFIGS
ncbi:MAG TPA: hypothetical protein VEA41_03790 [Salinarimonas sp.]|jgi:hypothetical protein|nr:hypothetical protein [Salinarimonas sp.]